MRAAHRCKPPLDRAGPPPCLAVRSAPPGDCAAAVAPAWVPTSPSRAPPPRPRNARARPQQHELLLAHSGAFLQHLLPTYCAAISAPSESGDARFFCLRMLSDALGACLSDPDLYEASLSTQGQGGAVASGGRREGAPAGGDGGGGGGHGTSTAAVDALLGRHVVPLVPGLLELEDPMPLYALKVRPARGAGRGPLEGAARREEGAAAAPRRWCSGERASYAAARGLGCDAAGCMERTSTQPWAADGRAEARGRMLAPVDGFH
jgi:hypothetical protein